MEYTGWFSSNLTPARKGVYERSTGNMRAYSMWDGDEWRSGSSDVVDAANRAMPSLLQRGDLFMWRGVTYETYIGAPLCA